MGSHNYRNNHRSGKDRIKDKTMAGTFSQIYIQVVFAVKRRQSLIKAEWKDELFKYITGIVSNKGQKLIAINGISDHIHILIGLKPSCCLSDLVREIKKSSNDFINEKHFSPFKFSWQEGYGAFSYNHSDLSRIIQYIQNQEIHHKKINFRQEYIEFLKDFAIDYEEQYLFEWFENE